MKEVLRIMPVALNESSTVYAALSRSWNMCVTFQYIAHLFSNLRSAVMLQPVFSTQLDCVFISAPNPKYKYGIADHLRVSASSLLFPLVPTNEFSAEQAVRREKKQGGSHWMSCRTDT